MDEDKVKEIVESMVFHNGKWDMPIDAIAMVQPGLARIMPEIGDRTWKLYYAGKAGNWENAMYQWKEGKKLFELGAFLRPKHEAALEEYIRESWEPIGAAIKAEDSEAFETAFEKCVVDANAWHEEKDKGHIVWKVPDFPPPDLDLTPRK